MSQFEKYDGILAGLKRLSLAVESNLSQAMFQSVVAQSAALNALQESLIEATHISHLVVSSSIADSLSVLVDLANNLNQVYTNSFAMLPNLQDALLSQVAASIEAAIPYMAPEQKTECQEDFLPKLSSPVKRKELTLDQILAIINLLVVIYFGIIASRPSDQLDRLIQLQEISIEQQQEEMIELKEEDLELRKTLDDLTDSINLLTDEVESLRYHLESAQDQAELDAQPDHEDSQNQNSNPEQ